MVSNSTKMLIDLCDLGFIMTALALRDNEFATYSLLVIQILLVLFSDVDMINFPVHHLTQ